MLFGSGTSELTAFEAAELANAVGSLAGGTDILTPLRETLGIDRLRLGSTEAGGALVSGGRYLARDVYLELASGAGLAEASIEWEIRPRLELATRFGLGTDSTVTLRWRKDY
jgi:autotransporter translocation and assembly factor TamB